MHETMARSVDETMEELEKKIRVVIEAIPKSRLIVVFRRW
jgi:BMFP domain-containing protein YqiC